MPTAIGTYRATEGIGILSTPGLSGWLGFQPAPRGYAAYDKHGYAWRVAEAEAAAIAAARQPEEPKAPSPQRSLPYHGDDFCLEHGHNHMRMVVGDVVPYCAACEGEEESEEPPL